MGPCAARTPRSPHGGPAHAHQGARAGLPPETPAPAAARDPGLPPEAPAPLSLPPPLHRQ